MRPGVRLGVDVGTVRIGVARCDPHAILASPVETVPRGSGDIDRIVALAIESDAIEVVVGLPIALSSRHTASTDDAKQFADALAVALEIPVRLVDERLSSVSANAALARSGRSSRSSRSVVDQVAAVIILQHAIDAERSTAKPPGVIVGAPEVPEGR